MKNAGRGGVGRRRALGIAAVITCALLVAPATVLAVDRHLRAVPGHDAAKPFFDSRVAARHAGTRAAASAGERSARTRLRSRLGRQAVVQVDPLSGTARSIQRLDGTLTGPAAGNRADVAMGWVRANRAALGLTAADVAGLQLAGRAVSVSAGVTHLRYRQEYEGIPTFDSGLRVNLDRGGRILNVTGAPIGDLALDSVEPDLGAAAAMRALQRNVEVERPIDVTAGPSGVRRVTRFAGGDFARLVIFAGVDGPVLAWHLTYKASSQAYYDAVVDASSGAVLYRQNLTKFADAEQEVFPNYPGAEAEGGVKGANNVKRTVGFEQKQWIADDALELKGPHVEVFSDLDDDDQQDPGEEIGRLLDTDDFDDTFDEKPQPFTNACQFRVDDGPWPDPIAQEARCSWDPAEATPWVPNRVQNGVQAFYLANTFYEHLLAPPIGFDADDGNFTGDDPVVINTDDGAATGPDSSHLNNAFMSTPPDGARPQMGMFLFLHDPGDPFPLRNVNGGDSAAVLWHEYTHGLSNRLVTNDDGAGALSSPQAGAMGEGWSDWYALDLLHREQLEFDNPGPGDVDLGMYVDAAFASLRFQPADCAVGDNSLRCAPGFATAPGGFTYGDFGKIAAVDTGSGPMPIPEVHADGEIWAQTLWDLRTQVGSTAAEGLITEAMRLSPPEPTFLDMRNAILAADEASGGTHNGAIWTAFAGRGMGFFASVVDSSDITPTESFALPPAPGAATGTTTGTVTSLDTGLPLAGASVGLGGLTTSENSVVPPALTGANGRYALTVPAGPYGDLLFSAPGYDRATAAGATVTAGVTRTRDAALRRDWAASSGGAQVRIDDLLYDNTGADFGCGLKTLIDQNRGVGWSAQNPASPDDTDPATPTAVIELPRAITIERFGLDPTAACGDDITASTKDYEIYTSPDGVTFKLAKKGAFTDDDVGRLNIVAPTANATNVRFVMLKLLTPLSVGGAGADFIDFSEIEVFGGPPNVLPSGALRAGATTVDPGESVQFTAAFTDPDSKITGYRWDFDGNGTVERTTTSPTATFAYPRGGDFTAQVAALDFAGGLSVARQAIHVTSAPSIDTPPTRGSRGRLRFRVSCELACTATAKLTLTKKLAKQLGLKKKRTVGSLRRTLAAGSATRVAIKLTGKAKRALKRHGRESVKATLSVTVRYADGRRDTAKRKVTIRL